MTEWSVVMIKGYVVLITGKDDGRTRDNRYAFPEGCEALLLAVADRANEQLALAEKKGAQ